MSTPAKTLSPSELAKLEHAFATDPSSEAYRPLAEAYLSMGRFMEAMVVCKKGVKAHPSRPDPRMLLARVYSEQGKDKKALEELVAATAVAPQDRALLRNVASLQFKTGEAEAGKASLLKAHELDPADAETQGLMAQWKVEAPKKVAPAAPPPQADPPTERVSVLQQAALPNNPPVLVPGAKPQAMPQKPPGGSIHVTSGSAHVNGAPPAPTPAPAQAQARPSGVRRAPGGVQNMARGSGARPAARGDDDGYAAPRASGSRPPVRAYDEEEDSFPIRTSQKKSAQARTFFTLLALLVVGLLGTFVFTQWHARNVKEFNRAQREALDALGDDSYDSYQRACKAAEAALEHDSSSVAAQGVLAYAYAIRWGEHGGGDDARKQAEEHLQAGKALGGDDSRLIAADALLKAYAGKASQAIDDLDTQVRIMEGQGRSSALLYATLGVLQMNAGDYEHALDNLTRAQQLASTDTRIYAQLGNLYRRRGEDKLAWKNFDIATRYKPNHPDSMLGKAFILLDSDRGSRFYMDAAAILKRLLDSQPPPSPRQLAEANMARALLVARVQAAIANLKPEERQELLQRTNVPADARAARDEITQDEDLAMKTLDRDNPELHLIKAHRLLAENNPDAAIEEVRKAIQGDGTRPQFYVELGRLLMRTPAGAHEAEVALKSAVQKVGESPKLMVMLGQAYRMDNKPDEALAQFTRAVADPKSKNPEARVAMGTIYFEKEDYAKAEQQLTRAAQELLNQTSKLAEVDNLLGRIYDARHDRAKADAAFKKALNADQEFTDAYYFYARFLGEDPGSRAQAHATAAEYLKLDPSGTYASAARQLLQ